MDKAASTSRDIPDASIPDALTSTPGTLGAAGHRQDGHAGPAGSGPSADALPVQIDCGDCVMRDVECGDCLVTVLLGPAPAELDAGEQRAIAALADSGLVPPLRMAR